MSLVIADKLVKNYKTGDVEVTASKGVYFTLEPAAFVSFVGPPGSGKNTLLNIIGCLDRLTTGTLTVSSTNVA